MKIRSNTFNATAADELISTGEGGARIIDRMFGIFKNPVPFFMTGAKVLTRLLYRVEYIDFDTIPKEGPAILICNHVSYVDGLVLHTGSPRPIRFLIDEEIYNLPGVNYFMRHYHAIPIMPNRESVKKAIEEVSKALSEGALVGIFPEGQLTFTGNMGRFRFGIEWMLKDNQVPVIPIALKGLWGSVFSRKYRRSKLRWLPRSFRRKVIAKCGPPIPHRQATVSHMQRVVMDLKSSI